MPFLLCHGQFNEASLSDTCPYRNIYWTSSVALTLPLIIFPGGNPQKDCLNFGVWSSSDNSAPYTKTLSTVYPYYGVWASTIFVLRQWKLQDPFQIWFYFLTHHLLVHDTLRLIQPPKWSRKVQRCEQISQLLSTDKWPWNPFVLIQTDRQLALMISQKRQASCFGEMGTWSIFLTSVFIMMGTLQ